jgi:hypothetical protein
MELFNDQSNMPTLAVQQQQQPILDHYIINNIEPLQVHPFEECGSENEFLSNESVISEIDDDISDLSDYDFNLHQELKEWATEFNVTMTSLKKLLSILQNIDKTLPTDPRTLLQTPQNLDIKAVTPGNYYHFGLVNGLKYVLQKSNIIANNIDIQINVDGLPLFNSSTKGFWVVLGKVIQIPQSVFVIGIYYGLNKPMLAEDFLSDTITELKYLEENNIHMGTFQCKVNLKGVCCDTPARAFVKCIKSHTGYYGCDRCTQKGDYLGRLVFLDSSANNRNDISFREKLQPEHHHGVSPFEEVSIDMSLAFPNDYMHSLCKGVGVKLLSTFKCGPLPNRLSASQISSVDSELLKVRDQIPIEFSRKPRSLQVLSMWKATEVRLFILYLGPAILPSIISHSQENMMKTYMCLFVASFSMGHPYLCVIWADKIKDWLRTFIAQCQYLFGDEFITYNVHSMLHLADDCSRLGPFDAFSCFPFENFLRFVKNTVKSPVMPLNQAVKRILESNVCLGQLTSTLSKSLELLYLQTEGVLPFHLQSHSNVLFYKGLKYANFSLLNNKKDAYFLAHGEIFKLLNVAYLNEKKLLICQKFHLKADFFTYPIQSSALGIYKVGDLQEKMLIISAEAVSGKYCLIESFGKIYASPILHTLL